MTDSFLHIWQLWGWYSSAAEVLEAGYESEGQWTVCWDLGPRH